MLVRNPRVMFPATVFASAALSAALVMILMTPAASADEQSLKLYDDSKCSNCHSIEKLGIERKIPSEKTKGPDLGATEHDATWITQWVLKEVEVDGKTHMNTYKGTKKDLEKLADWLVGLKTP